MVDAPGCSKSGSSSRSSRRPEASSAPSSSTSRQQQQPQQQPQQPQQQRRRRSRSSHNIRSKSYIDLVSPVGSYQDIHTLHKRNCKKYFCLCKKHVVSEICVNETRKLYWFNDRSVDEKIYHGSTEGYYNKLLRLVNGALHNWATRYIEGLGLGGVLNNLGSNNNLPAASAGAAGAGAAGTSTFTTRPKKDYHHQHPTGRGGGGGGGTGKGKKKVMLKINGSAKGNMKLLKEGCYCHYHPHITADVCNADFLRRVKTAADDDDFDALTPAWMVFIGFPPLSTPPPSVVPFFSLLLSIYLTLSSLPHPLRNFFVFFSYFFSDSLLSFISLRRCTLA